MGVKNGYKNKSKSNIQTLNEYVMSMTSGADKHCRSQAKVKTLILLKNIRENERQAMIDHLITVLSETTDPCLQNYLADILIFQCDPAIDSRLLDVVNKNNGVADFVRVYVNSMINNNKHKR